MERALPFGGAPLLVEGAAGTGKTEFLVRRTVDLVDSGAAPNAIALFAATPAGARALEKRLEHTLEDILGNDPRRPRVSTLRAFELDLLATPEAQTRFGRRPITLFAFEETLLLEDLKLTEVAPRRLAEMLKFFYRSWADLEPMDEAWFYGDEERRVYEHLQRALEARGAYLTAELGRRAWKLLHDDEAMAARYGFAHVLVDDAPLLSRASQQVALLAARESFAATGETCCGTRALEDYPCPSGLNDLAEAFPQAHRILLHESHKSAEVARVLELVAADIERAADSVSTPPPSAPSPRPSPVATGIADTDTTSEAPASGATMATCYRAEDEFEAAADLVTAMLRNGRMPEDIALAGTTSLWACNLAKALKRRGIPYARIGAVSIGGDVRDTQCCHLARAVTLLKLIADPADPVALRSWCGFGDHLANSHLMVASMASGGLSLDTEDIEDACQTSALNRQEATRVLQALSKGRTLIASLEALRGQELLEGACAAVGSSTAEAVPAALRSAAQACGPTADAATLVTALEQRCLFPAFDGAGVAVGTLDDFIGLSRPVMIVAGLANGLLPKRSYFDPARVERDKRPALLARDQQRVYAALAVAEEELHLSTFSTASLAVAEKLQLKIDRVRLKNGERLCEISPSETVRAVTGVHFRD